MTAAVTEAVERAVRSALDELNGELEQLVAAELERQVEQLAAGVLAERLGTDARARVTETKVCRGCSRTLPGSAFEKGRGTCRECRRRQERERAQARARAEGRAVRRSSRNTSRANSADP